MTDINLDQMRQDIDNIDEKLAKMIHKNVVPDIRFEDIPEIDRIHILD